MWGILYYSTYRHQYTYTVSTTGENTVPFCINLQKEFSLVNTNNLLISKLIGIMTLYSKNTDFCTYQYSNPKLYNHSNCYWQNKCHTLYFQIQYTVSPEIQLLYIIQYLMQLDNIKKNFNKLLNILYHKKIQVQAT